MHKHTRTHAQTRTNTHARTHKRAHTHIHTMVQVQLDDFAEVDKGVNNYERKIYPGLSILIRLMANRAGCARSELLEWTLGICAPPLLFALFALALYPCSVWVKAPEHWGQMRLSLELLFCQYWQRNEHCHLNTAVMPMWVAGPAVAQNAHCPWTPDPCTPHLKMCGVNVLLAFSLFIESNRLVYTSIVIPQPPYSRGNKPNLLISPP